MDALRRRSPVFRFIRSQLVNVGSTPPPFLSHPMTAISDRFVALTGLDDQTQLEFSSTTCGIPPRRSAHAGVQTPIYPSDTDPVQPPTTVLHLLPIADQVTQQKIWGEIVSWLRHCETRNLQLSSVTDDTFRSLFIRLVVLADPTCAPLSNSKEILELEETTEWKYTFHCILEKLFYPFIDSVNLQWVDHPMDCASWPYLLSILYWLTTKGKVRLRSLILCHLITLRRFAWEQNISKVSRTATLMKGIAIPSLQCLHIHIDQITKTTLLILASITRA